MSAHPTAHFILLYRRHLPCIVWRLKVSYVHLPHSYNLGYFNPLYLYGIWFLWKVQVPKSWENLARVGALVFLLLWFIEHLGHRNVNTWTQKTKKPQPPPTSLTVFAWKKIFIYLNILKPPWCKKIIFPYL